MSRRLHEEFFAQDGYEPTQDVLEYKRVDIGSDRLLWLLLTTREQKGSLYGN